MEATRRMFVSSAAAGAAAFGLGGLAAASTLRPSSGAKPQDWDAERLSMAVVDAAAAQCAETATKAVAGRVTAGDLRASAATLKVAFGHFDEVGLTASEERRMLDPSAPGQPLAEDDLIRVHERMVAAGFRIKRDSLRDLLSPRSERTAPAVASVRRAGMRRVHRQMVAELERAAVRLERGHGEVRQASLSPAASEQFDCQGLQLLIDVVTLIVALNAAGSLVCPAFAAVAAIEGIILAVLGLVNDIYC